MQKWQPRLGNPARRHSFSWYIDGRAELVGNFKQKRDGCIRTHKLVCVDRGKWALVLARKTNSQRKCNGIIAGPMEA